MCEGAPPFSPHAALSVIRPLALVFVALTLPACLPSRAAAPDLPPSVPYLTRAEWGARPPAFDMIPQTPTRLTIHHTATHQKPDADPAATLRGLQSFSQREDTLGNGKPKVAWADIPYHYYITPNGTVAEARDPEFEGDSNTSYDLSGHVQVVLEGNFMEESPTPAQMRSLLALARSIGQRYGIGPDDVAGHQDRAGAQTLCPGDALHARLDEVRAVMPRSVSGRRTEAKPRSGDRARL